MAENKNIETMSDVELGLLLESLYQQAFQVNQNIQAVGNQLRSRLPKTTIETSTEQQPPTE
jgi:hypothetical protein